MIKVKIVNTGKQPLPVYATAQSAGMDLRANIDSPITLHPMERQLIPTGLRIALPEGFEAQVRPRSGLAIKHGIVPPTINFETPDEKIDQRLNFTFNQAQKRDVKVAMSNTFGFGGHNACLLFKKL